jgi:pimeloyl-ACP methyl ester carboxylesterase
MYRKSSFKDPVQDLSILEDWVYRLENLNGRQYERIWINTRLGKTLVYGLHTKEDAPGLIIFPGLRTSSLFWDFDRGLDALKVKMRIYMVETNGLPNFSEGNSPDIRSLDYGHWANEVMEQLGLQQAFVAGASFGGLVCMKLAIVNPEKIKAAFLLNPGCLQFFSLKYKNLYYNLLPIIHTTEKNVREFLDNAVFAKPNHCLTPAAERLIVDYALFAIGRHRDRGDKPYNMDRELKNANVTTYLLLGDQDILFPFQKSIEIATKYLPKLNAIKVFENVGHGIETFGGAIGYIGEVINAPKTA